MELQFVMQICREALLLISSMVEMGHKLGYGIVAEGVETTEQLNVIRRLGCETGQGTLFGGAVDAEAMGEMLQQTLEQKVGA